MRVGGFPFSTEDLKNQKPWTMTKVSCPTLLCTQSTLTPFLLSPLFVFPQADCLRLGSEIQSSLFIFLHSISSSGSSFLKGPHGFLPAVFQGSLPRGHIYTAPFSLPLSKLPRHPNNGGEPPGTSRTPILSLRTFIAHPGGSLMQPLCPFPESLSSAMGSGMSILRLISVSWLLGHTSV